MLAQRLGGQEDADLKADKVTLVAERIDDGKLHATFPPNGAVAIHPREIPDRFARDLSGDGIAAALLDVFACGRRELVQQRRPLKSPTVTSHRVSTNQQGHARRRERPKARLVVAKLDQLARNVAFISRPMESGVEFVAADMPFTNKFTIHILAAVAEMRRAAISFRFIGILSQTLASSPLAF